MNQVFKFLKNLEQHNNREWFHEHKEEYLTAKSVFEEVVGKLILEISSFDKAVEDLEPKNCIFRIHRDVRFGKNKLPYKTSFGASISPGGKQSTNPTYYVHAEVGKSMIAAGVYMPPAEELRKIRQEIDYNAEGLLHILEEDDFKSTYGELKGEALKTAPKGYPKDHPNIELLRFKSFIVWTEVKDSLFTQPNSVTEIGQMFKIAQPFNKYLSVAMS
ncbi:MAG: DUF2461 domain-containing protein [Cyclobacteriaceae bacterium]